MKTLTRAEAAEFLKAHDNYCLLSHRRPDGDTVGSNAALCLGLRQLGKKAVVLENPELTPRFAWLLEGLTVPQIPQGWHVVTVDVASPDMLPMNARELRDVLLRLDHHSAATSFTEYELVDGDSSSCAELIWDVLELAGVTMDQPIADAVYVGMTTDNGCFRFGNTTAHSFEVAAQCVKAGARFFRLNQELFEISRVQRHKMQAWIVDHLEMVDPSTALIVIPREVETALGVVQDDLDNISNFPRTIEGVHLAVTLRQEENGEIKLSVRAIPGRDASAIARRFGGGGHTGAAGATLEGQTLEAAAQAVREALAESL